MRFPRRWAIAEFPASRLAWTAEQDGPGDAPSVSTQPDWGMSGDGVGGASFSIGFLQGLASLGLIRRLDYVSAVADGSRRSRLAGRLVEARGG